MSSESRDDDICKTALEAAFQRGMEICENQDQKERATSRLMGLTNKDGEPDVDCSAALEEGFTDETCSSSRGSRQMAMCMVWNENPVSGEPLIDHFDGNFESAVQAANSIVDFKCGEVEKSSLPFDAEEIIDAAAP